MIRTASVRPVTPAPAAAASLTPIPAIQGPGDASPLVGSAVTTSGVVTGIETLKDFRTGATSQVVFVQDPTGDGKAATSDAVAVRPSANVDIAVGQQVSVSGTVAEIDGMTTIGDASLAAGAMSKTPVAPLAVSLPASQQRADRWMEQHEGMLTTLDQGLVLAPTQSYGVFTVVDAAHHAPAKDYDHANTGTHLPVSGDMGHRIEVATGDRVGGIVGPIEQSHGSYRLLQRDEPTITTGPGAAHLWGDVDGSGAIDAADVAAIKARAGSAASGPLDPADLDGNGKVTASDATAAAARAKRITGAPSFTIANVNAENFFDTVDNPAKKDMVLTPEQYQQKLTSLAKLISHELGAPTLVGMEEVENATVLKDLVSQPELKKLGYSYAIIEGPDFRGINPALIYRDNVTVSNLRQEQGKTNLDDNKGPIPPSGEKGDLFARPPLLADVTITGPEGTTPEQLTVMVNHFMSSYSPQGRPTEPWRIEQAQFVRDLTTKLVKDDPARGVVMLGDLNDNDTSTAIGILLDPKTSPLHGLAQEYTPRGERYSYQYMGSSQQLDHVMTTADVAQRTQLAQVHHVHADLPAKGSQRPTDHDILETTISFAPAG